MPLSNFIVSSYRILIEIALWLLLLIALVRGAEYGGFGGAILGVVTAAIAEIVVFGIALIILDIQKNVRKIAENKNVSGAESTRTPNHAAESGE